MVSRDCGIHHEVCTGEVRRNREGVIVGVLPASSMRQRVSQRRSSSTLRRRVRFPELALGGVLVVAGAVGSVLWGTRGPDQRVLVAARDLHRGEVLDTGAVRWAAVSGDRIAAQLDPATLVGRVLSGDVPVGSPLVPAHIRPVRPIADDEVGVGVSLERGMCPPDLAEGDEVMLVVTGPTDAGGSPSVDAFCEGIAFTPAETEVLGAPARVYRLDSGEASVDGRVVIGLVVNETQVVALSSAERIHLVRSDLRASQG